MPPTFADGKICYVEMPAADIPRSAEFHRNVFGWSIRSRGDAGGAESFERRDLGAADVEPA